MSQRFTQRKLSVYKSHYFLAPLDFFLLKKFYFRFNGIFRNFRTDAFEKSPDEIDR